MTATELREITDGLPMEAMPKGRFACVTIGNTTEWIDDEGPIGDATAVLAVEASMIRWLAQHPKYHGSPLPFWRCGDQHWHFGNTIEFYADSPVYTLAAAVKAVAGKRNSK